MDTAETPKNPRAEWEDMIKVSHLIRNPEDRKMMMEVEDKLIEMLLKSDNALIFYDSVKPIYPGIGDIHKPETLDRKFLLIMELINERARNRMEEEEAHPEAQGNSNKFLASLRKRLRKMFGHSSLSK